MSDEAENVLFEDEDLVIQNQNPLLIQPIELNKRRGS